MGWLVVLMTQGQRKKKKTQRGKETFGRDDNKPQLSTGRVSLRSDCLSCFTYFMNLHNSWAPLVDCLYGFSWSGARQKVLSVDNLVSVSYLLFVCLDGKNQVSGGFNSK